MKKRVTSFLVVAVVTTASAAGAQTAPRKAKSVASAPDSDDAEPPSARAPSRATSKAEPLFQRLDTDGNGVVSQSELLTAVIRHVRERVRVRFAQLDQDGDGRVSRAEVAGMSEARFNRFDLNRDGFFTASELRLVMERKMVPRVARFLPRIDRDGDGRCNEAELKRHFESVARRRAPSKDGAVAGTERPVRTSERPSG